MSEPVSIQERFQGCLFGLAIGDALGGKFEAQSAEGIRARFTTVDALMAYPQEEIWYTDDTQMAIGICETLISQGEIVEEHLCNAFVSNYVPSRGYGRGARAVLNAMELGQDHRAVAERFFPGGSYGNGAAMRSAPVGLLFRDDPQRLWEQARLSALPTHKHPLGIEGGQLLALAVSLSSQIKSFQPEPYFATLIARCETIEFREQLTKAAQAHSTADLAALGNRIEALYSVPTAIAAFALTPESFEQTIGNAIFLGGDTDTIAAMAGAISGAHLGIQKLPSRLVNLIESSPKGRDYIQQLAMDLLDVYQRVA